MSIQNQQTLQQYAKPLQISPTKNDINAPFSYQDWYSLHQGIIPGQEYLQYNEYLVNWFKNRNSDTIDEKLQIKLNYLSLLRQLQLFFTEEETENWYNKVDLNNEKELLLAIPYFAKKLKEIALYYIQLRKNIKESRLKYNQVGSNFSLIDQLQKILLTTYSQKNNKSTNIPYQIWKNVPTLSSLNTNLNIKIEELYDDQNYFDLSTEVPVSTYFNLTSEELEHFLTSRGLQLTSSNWIYKLGIFSLSGEDLFDYNQKLNSKYLGQSKYTSQSVLISSIQQEVYPIEINSGNNYFLWPGVSYTDKAKTLPPYNPILINEIDDLLTLGTGGSSIENSDTIFVKTQKGIEGAWLSKQLFTNIDTELTAVCEPYTKTTFRYPFPGYGLSGEGTTWTGFSLKTTPQYFYLDENTKNSIAETYWSTNISLTTTPGLKINNSSLIQSGAFANLQYSLADKVKTFDGLVPYNNTSISENSKESWLYKFTETDISINRQNSVILWPYKNINPLEDFPDNLPDNLTEVCSIIPVSSINFSYATAASSINFADKIFKLTNYQDTLNQAIECCWLSGRSINYPFGVDKILTIQQASFQGIFTSGTFTPFIWTGPDTTDLNLVFKSINHQKDCKFLTTPNTTYKDFKLCTCGQTKLTPFGHPGTSFTDYSSFADYIYEVNDTTNIPNLESAQKSKFAWFRTNNKPTWGYGNWISNDPQSNNKFYLRTGKLYYYYRAEIQTGDKNIISLPDLGVRYNFNTYSANYNNHFTWIQGIKQSDNNWYSKDEPSSMTFAPGDVLLYQKAAEQSVYILGTVPLTSFVAENRGSLWSDYDYIALGAPPGQPEQQFFVSVPPIYSLYSGNNKPAQIPSFLDKIQGVWKWTITAPNNSITEVFESPGIIVIPTQIGMYTVSVMLSVKSGNSTTIQTFTNIPPIEVISPYTTEPSLTSYGTPLPGFVLKTPLQGWDYNTNQFNLNARTNRGAKPFWATTYTEKTSATDYKGIYSFGAPIKIIDDYNIITQPEFSDIVFKTGQYLEYDRQLVTRLNWVQPLTLSIYANKKQWNTIFFDISAESNLSPLLDKNIYDLVTTPTTSSSNILLRNYVNDKPVEIFYNAINSFTWNVSVTPVNAATTYTLPTAIEILKPIVPWANFSNQNYPTIAVYPSITKLYSSKKTGVFFTPTYLGASTFVENNYTATLIVSSTALTGYFENPNTTVNARGLSQTDVLSPYSVTYNSTWLKEPLFVGPIAGSINKKVFKKYQKLIPYQSTYETNSKTNIGLILPNSRQTPWTGNKDEEWGDLINYPISPTGELNIQQWKDSQVLKNQKDLQLDCWVTDIFGNQYGLYKNYKNSSAAERINIPGKLWVRNNKQLVQPASEGMARVFDSYITSALYNQLTGFGIYKIDLFYDTLLIETQNTIIFEKLNYDYNNDTIFSLTDNARFIVLQSPSTTNIGDVFNSQRSSIATATPGETWFFPESKQLYISIGEFDYTTDDTTQPTFFWEFANNTSNTLLLNGTIPLPSAPDQYIVSIGGVIQPHTIYTINPLNRTLRFNFSFSAPVDVFVIIPYNPLYSEKYDGPPRQYIVNSPFSQTNYFIPDLLNSTTNESQYVVSVGGVAQQPRGIPDNPYDIVINQNPYISFSEPLPPNQSIIITRLPKYNVCSNSEFYSWTNVFSFPVKQMSLIGGLTNISPYSGAYLVNIGGVLQSPSTYSINNKTKQIIFKETIPPNVYICVTHLSVPQKTKVIPTLYLLDLNTQNLKKVFPNTTSQLTTLNSLTGLDIVSIDRPVLSYNEITNQFLYTITGQGCDKDLFIIETTINNLPTLQLKDIVVYRATPEKEVTGPPIIPQNLYEQLAVLNNVAPTLDVTCPVANGPAVFVPVNLPNWVKLSSNGRFTGTAPIPSPLFYENVYHVTFYAYNDYGRVYSSLTIRVVKPVSYIRLQETSDYLIDNVGDRFVVIE